MSDIKKIKRKFMHFFRMRREDRHTFDAMFDRYTFGIPTLLDNLRCLLFDKPSQKSPFFILWYVTRNCNCRCSFCNLDLEGTDLNTKQAKDVALQIGRSNTCVVALSGGEPFIREEIFDIIKILRKYKKFVSINTNGLLLEAYCDKIISLGIEQLEISVDSHLPQIHDRFRNRKGAFEKVIRGIETLRKKRRGERPFIAVRAVIAKENFKQLGDYIDFFKDKVNAITFQPLWILSNSSIDNKSQLTPLNKEDVPKLRHIIKDLAKKHSFLRLPYYQLMPDFIDSPQKLIDNNLFRCLDKSAFTLQIKYNGDVSLCLHTHRTHFIDADGNSIKGLPLGNVKHDMLMDLWRSERCFMIQKYLRSKRNKCICWCAGNYMNTDLARFFK